MSQSQMYTDPSPRRGPRFPRAAMVAGVQAAIAAPSIHNSQPWRFRFTGDHIEVYADQSHRLEVIDPVGRELLISVGAALFNLRVAMYEQGRAPEVRLFPDAAEPDLVARVGAGQPVPPDAGVTALAQAIPVRHTNRLPFAHRAIPAAVMETLQDAARAEGAMLTPASAVARNAILGLVRTAEHQLRARGEYRAELIRWTAAVRGRRDGVPPQAFGPWDAMEALPLRDFGLGRPELHRAAQPFEPFPAIVVLATAGDDAVHWVRSGQALQRVLLQATGARLAATPMSQPLEIPALRELITDPRSGRWAQVILRLGYAPPTARTPRRALAEVLTDADASTDDSTRS